MEQYKKTHDDHEKEFQLRQEEYEKKLKQTVQARVDLKFAVDRMLFARFQFLTNVSSIYKHIMQECLDTYKHRFVADTAVNASMKWTGIHMFSYGELVYDKHFERHGLIVHETK